MTLPIPDRHNLSRSEREQNVLHCCCWGRSTHYPVSNTHRMASLGSGEHILRFPCKVTRSFQRFIVLPGQKQLWVDMEYANVAQYSPVATVRSKGDLNFHTKMESQIHTIQKCKDTREVSRERLTYPNISQEFQMRFSGK